MLDEVIKQLRDYGLIVDAPEIGKLVRCDVEGDRKGSKNGWYSLFEFRLNNGNDIIAGAYGSWKRGDSQKVSQFGLKLSRPERNNLNKQIQENKRIAQELREKAALAASKRATKLWKNAARSGESGYLARKQVKPYGVRFNARGSVIIPLFNVQGIITGLQYIHDNKGAGGRDKEFAPAGMVKKGSFFLIGDVKSGKPLCFVEGYATGASLHEALGLPVVVAFDSGNLLPCAEALRGVYKDSPFIFCADDDWQTTDHQGYPYNPGMQAAQKAAAETDGLVAAPVFKKRAPKDVDFNDMHVAEGLEAIQRCFEKVLQKLNHWRRQLSRTKSGALEANPRNVYMILGNDSRWQGVLGFSELAYRTIKLKEPPFNSGTFKAVNNEWRDDDTNRTDVWLAENYGISARKGVIDDAIDLVARDNTFHPVRQYLHGLEWDKKKRLFQWLSVYLGVPLSEYSKLVGIKWMIGAVARVMEVPCKVDNLIILEGDQGKGKSTALAILGGEWYSDTHFALGDKDGYQQILGVWICELSELDSFNKAESSRAKSFFTSTVDRYRPSYGTRAQDFPRQCVFGGSTNQESYFKDTTGNRRYWPVRCGYIDLEQLREDRDQLWAEAYYWYQKGTTWHVEQEEAHLFEVEQEQRQIVDSWQTHVADWLDDAGQRMQNDFSLADIFTGALNMEPAQARPPEQTRLANILNNLGWKKYRPKADPNGSRSKRAYKYRRPPEEMVVKQDGDQ